MKKRQFYTFGLFVIFSLLAFLHGYFISQKTNLRIYASKIEGKINEQEALVERVFGQFSKELQSGRAIDLSRLEELTSKEFSLFLYKKDSLLFWSGNEVEPSMDLLLSLDSISFPGIFRLSNGYYELLQKQIATGNDEFRLVAAIPIKKTFSLESNYLSNSFSGNGSLPKGLDISEEATPYPIVSKNGQSLFYLKASGDVKDRTQQKISLFLYLLAFILLAILINEISNYLVRRYYPGLGAAFLFLSVFGIRYLSIANDFSANFVALPIFERTFNTPVLNSSLGDLLINSILLLWMMTFFHREFRLKPVVRMAIPLRFVLTGLSYFCIVLGLLMITAVFKSLVIESGLTFDFDNVFNLGIFSFIAIISAILLLIALFLFSHRMMLTISGIGLTRYFRLGALALAIISSLPLALALDLLLPPVLIVLITITYIALFDLFIDSRIPGLTWVVIWLAGFSAFSSILLFKYNINKDFQTRLKYAVSLAEVRDSLVETALRELGPQLRKDDSLSVYFTVPVPFTVEEQLVKTRIDRHFITNHYLFSNYTYDIFVLNQEYNQALIEGQDAKTIHKKLLLQLRAQTSGDDALFLLPENDWDYLYMLRFLIPTPGNPDNINIAALGIKQKKRDASLVYTELLLDSDYKGLKNLRKYDYAIYKNGNLQTRYGKPNEALYDSNKLTVEGDWEESFSSARADLVYLGPSGTTVIIGKVIGGYIKPLSLFSYLFVLIIFIVALLSFLNLFIKAIPSSLDYPFSSKPSLRNKIQLSVIALILGSFIIIGLVTVTFFRTSSIIYHENRLSRKISAVLKDIEHELTTLSSFGQNEIDLSAVSAPLSDIHNMDINIYDLQGRLIFSSAKYIFNKGIISHRMNPSAYYALSMHHINLRIQEEEIGSLEYKAAYAPLRNPADEIIAFLGLPYYSKDRKLKSDLYDFMGTLLNAYVFLLLLAGVIAIAVANSITKPISRIGKKLKQFKLGRRNEPLEWSSQDELGELIAEFNSMIGKLEESAERLKQSEREGAWREMAKQVAHEIKNPLTPMKLSIQYLMHAYKSKPENVGELLPRVSTTLIEQIEGLSRIASEFSNFAKMPAAQNQEFNLNELLGTVHDLYRENKNDELDIKLHLPERQYTIYADKEQLMRVLNNLIKNAIQAIPDGRKGMIDISLFHKQSNVVIKVSDNGIGISDEMREKVFYPNFTTKTSGMGLGLGIIKNIVDALEGKIYFHTEVGKGSDFFVELPMRD